MLLEKALRLGWHGDTWTKVTGSGGGCWVRSKPKSSLDKCNSTGQFATFKWHEGAMEGFLVEPPS